MYKFHVHYGILLELYLWERGEGAKLDRVRNEKPFRTTHSPSDPTGSSGTGMTLQKGSELNQNDHALISPSILIISSWIWTAPWRCEMWVGLLSSLIQYLKGWRAKTLCQQHSQSSDLSLMGTWAAHNLVPVVLYV